LKDDDLAGRIEADYRTADLDPRRLAMLEYAEKLTRTPAAMGAGDVEALRGVGFSDADVLHIAEVTSYYAYVNRIADGLGVDLEPWIWEIER
jgi:uncharacterized peroxidase-related enzyme